MTTKQPFVFDKMVGGMSRYGQPFQLPNDTWLTQFNLRTVKGKITQIGRKRPYLFGTENGPITAIVNIPLSDERRGYVVGLGTQVSRLNTIEEVVAVPSTSSAIAVGSTPWRWNYTQYEGKVYFTNPDNLVRFTDGLTVGDWSSLEFQPAAKYIEVFYDHLFVANVNYLGSYSRRVMWTDLRSFGRWSATRKNEADYYDFLETDTPFLDGITGLKKLGNLLCAYTASHIYIGQYVGLPNVMRWDMIVGEVSNDFMYSLVAVDKFHFFISEKWHNIFVFDGNMPRPIGDSIADYFFDDLTTDQTMQQQTYGYVDTQHNEIWWVYKSKASNGPYDKAIVFNILTQKWYVASVEDVTCFTQQITSSKGMDRLTGTQINALGGTINGLGSTLANHTRIWGTQTGLILREEQAGDGPTDLLYQPEPFLETGDLYFGNPEEVKEIETLLVQANIGDYTSMRGVQVWYKAKQNADDDVPYFIISKLWRPRMEQGRLSFPRDSARYFRFRFMPFSKWNTNPDNKKQTKTFQPVPAGPSKDVVVGGGVQGFSWSNFLLNVYGIKHDQDH